MSKLVPSTTEFWVGPAPEQCDLCTAPIIHTFVDGKTQSGPWANMCPACARQYGVGLGTGKGQAYQLVDGKWAKLVPAAAAKPPGKRKQPSMKTLERWSEEGVAKATDGCKVEPDGTCSHGCKSWLLELGLV